MLTGRQILLALSIKFNGDWQQIYSAIQSKYELTPDEADTLIASLPSDLSYITIIDNDYPQNLKAAYKPPFVLYYKGDFSLVNNRNLVSAVGDLVWDEHVALFNKKHSFILSGMNSQSVVDACFNQDSIFISSNGFTDTYFGKSFGLVLSEYPNSIDNTEELASRLAFSLRIPISLAYYSLFIGVKSRKSSPSLVAHAYALYLDKPVAILKTTKDTSTNQRLISDGHTGILNLDDLYLQDKSDTIDISRLS
jgi:predicted Rossmann fold nucleotide-binding protein DprA/Smf involved in DNA uptake